MKADRRDREIHVSELIVAAGVVNWIRGIAGLQGQNLQLRVTPQVRDSKVTDLQIDIRNPIGDSHGGGENAIFALDRDTMKVTLLHSSSISGMQNLNTELAPPVEVKTELELTVGKLENRVATIMAARHGSSS